MEKENAKAKKTSKSLVIGLIAAAVIIVAAVVLFIFKPWAPGYVASVDNMKVSKQEYTMLSKFNMNQFVLSLSNGTATADPSTYDWSTKVGTETAKDQVKKSTLDYIQEIKIQLLKAKDAGVKLTSEDVKGIDDQINQQISSSGGRQAAEKSTKDMYGVSLSEYKDVLKDLVLVQKYMASEQAKSAVKDDEVKKQYDDNKKDYDKVTVVHILLSTKGSDGVEVSDSKKAEIREKAEGLLAQIKAGADIKELAEKNSDDKPAVTTKDSEGYQGEYTLSKSDNYVTEFKDWAFQDHKPGDAAIVETEFGYHVMQFQKRVETPFDDVKDSIKSGLVSSAWTEKLDGWKKDAKYAVKPNDSAIAEVDKGLYGI